jgi:hypothetical protein
MSLTVRASLLGSALLLAGHIASAQSFSAPDSANSEGYSSSQAGLSAFTTHALPEALDPAAAGLGGGQYGGTYGGGSKGEGSHTGWLHNRTYEFGGGFSGPVSKSLTYGGNFTVGGGFKFNQRLSALAEYQFIDAKLPGYLIAEAGANGGNAHIWSLTIDPVFDLFPKSANDFYVTGGGGFYRKLTSFTDIEEEVYCYYYCEVGTASTVVGHFSSNQGGWNAGAGYQRRIGSSYGDSNLKLFVEARYLDVFTPAVYGSANGLGVTTIQSDTKMIPVTFGVRF